MMYYPPNPFFEQRLHRRVFLYLVTAHPLRYVTVLQRTLTYRVLRVASLAFLAYSNLYPRNCLDIYEAQGSL